MGNMGGNAMPLAKVSKTRPSMELVGGYRVGDIVYFQGVPEEWENGDKLVVGFPGKVTGPASSSGHDEVDVLFHENQMVNSVSLTDITKSREQAQQALQRGLPEA